MITSIFSNTPYFQVNSPPVPYVSGQIAGQLRWNPTMNCMEVSSGSGWQTIGGMASITASTEFNDIMNWAKQEIKKSEAIKKLAESSPAVAEALKAYELAAEQLTVLAVLADKGKA